jgi:hypothetical protein
MAMMIAYVTGLTSIFMDLFFGELWFIGLLIFMLLTISLMRMWKYSAAFLLPMIFALEYMYYERIDAAGSLIWPMIICLFLAVGVASYAVFGKDD